MENQELMKLCFEISLVMRMAQTGQTFNKEVVIFQDEAYLPPEIVRRAVQQWNPKEISLEWIISALEVGFKVGLFEKYQKLGVIHYKQSV